MFTDDRSVDRDAMRREVARRRTFAIISHPDAGKTTLTEKLLLYAGAIELAGAVRGRKSRRHATSDWMELEQQRGISISAAAVEFELRGHHVTLLDTPGHQDFSEDTHRTLLAVDSVVMVIDAAKGIEAQTLKLFEVCRARRVPVLTFVTSWTSPVAIPSPSWTRFERVLGVAVAPVTWPLGDGADFRGVYDLDAGALLLYERDRPGVRTAPIAVTRATDPQVATIVGAQRQRELVDAVRSPVPGPGSTGAPTSRGHRRPCSSGAPCTTSGWSRFSRRCCHFAPPPSPRPVDSGEVQPDDPDFSGFVFKIQANMNPRHRDRVAFLRVAPGD